MASLQHADRFSLIVSLGLAAVPLGCGDEVGSQTASESSSGEPSTASDTDDPSASGVTLDPTSDESSESSGGEESESSGTTEPSVDTSGTTGPMAECDADAACDDDLPCTEDRCVDGQCESTEMHGVPAPDDAQTEDDCTVVTCIAGFPVDEADDTDPPDDGDECTMDICVAGVPSHPAIVEGACAPEVDCDNGVDDDLDGPIDCLDDDCDGIDGCEFATELTCFDGGDNDTDGLVDCLDDDCDTIAGCELGLELSCDDGFDNDGDSVWDCSDPDCTAAPECQVDEYECNDGIDNDSDGLVDAAEPQCSWVAAALPGCPAGNLLGFSANDLPLAIPPVGTSTRNSYIQIVGVGGTVANAAVRIDILHTYDSDLDILLYSPFGTSRELSTDNGGVGGAEDNFTNTVFTDSGPGVIGTPGFNNPPYAGTYRPEQAFTPTLVGEAINGDWNLRVIDQFNADGGSINLFQLGLCAQ